MYFGVSGSQPFHVLYLGIKRRALSLCTKEMKREGASPECREAGAGGVQEEEGLKGSSVELGLSHMWAADG